jgi:hypothetical protein
MTTARQITANRVNARSSTGPQTEQGKASASRSALRHGLSIPVLSDPGLAKKVEDLALKIAGENASPVLLDLARAIAEAQIDLDRARAARHQLIAWEPGEPDPFPPSLPMLRRLPYTRHETRSSIRWRCSLDDFIKDRSKKIADGKKRGGEKFAATLVDRVFTLESLDRYECRARSRRKSATRAFDAERADAAQTGS